MALALQAPEKIADFVAVDNAPVDALLSTDFPSYIRAMQIVDQSHVKKLAEADLILQQVEKVVVLCFVAPFQATFYRSDILTVELQSLPIRQFLLGNLYRESGKNTQKFCIPLNILGDSLGHLGDFPFKSPDLVRFEKPALFVRGTKSKYVPDEVLPVIGQFFPRFRLVDIGAGHWVISEQPEEFKRGKNALSRHLIRTNLVSSCGGISTESRVALPSSTHQQSCLSLSEDVQVLTTHYRICRQ